jgi:hypothetical protein
MACFIQQYGTECGIVVVALRLERLNCIPFDYLIGCGFLPNRAASY